MPRTETARTLAHSFAADKMVRRFRVLTAQRKAAQRAANRGRRLAAMRFATMGLICMTATIVLNESANERWSGLVLGSSRSGGASNPLASATRGAAGPVTERPPVLVTLGEIEVDSNGPLVLRPASAVRVRTWGAPVDRAAPQGSSIARGGEAALAAAELGGEMSRPLSR